MRFDRLSSSTVAVIASCFAVSACQSRAGRSATVPDEASPGRAPSTLTVQYPSADFPPVPAFRLSIPNEWVALPKTKSLMVVRAPDPAEGFHANVVVSARRVAPADDPAAMLAAAIEQDLENSDYEVLKTESSPAGPTPSYAVVVRFRSPDGIELETHQIQVYVPASDRSAYLMSITGSFAAKASRSEREVVRSAVWSFQLGKRGQ